MISAKVIDTKKSIEVGFDIGYIQIDNQSEPDPIFPVMLKPKYLKAYDLESKGGLIGGSQHENETKTFQLALYQLKDIPNVVYFDKIEYLLQTLLIKIEFSHILRLSQFATIVGDVLNKNLTWTHSIFLNADEANNAEVRPVTSDEITDRRK